MITLKDYQDSMITDGRESVIPEGKLEVITRYTKEAMHRIYHQVVDVFFCSFEGSRFEGYEAIYRPDHFPPINFNDVKKHNDSIPSITFNTDFFKKETIELKAWIVILHEVTHHELPAIAVKKGESWDIQHPPNFEEKVIENAEKAGDLPQQFMSENGFSEKDVESLFRSLI